LYIHFASAFTFTFLPCEQAGFLAFGFFPFPALRVGISSMTRRVALGMDLALAAGPGRDIGSRLVSIAN